MTLIDNAAPTDALATLYHYKTQAGLLGILEAVCC